MSTNAIPNSLSASAFINETVSRNTLIHVENGRAGYKTTGSKCLDMFSVLSRGSPEAKVTQMFKDAYAENPELALKVMMNYRDRHGKQEKDIPRIMMKVLKDKCPSTYMANLLLFLENGYLKDLLVLSTETECIRRQCKRNIAKGIEAKVFAALLKADREALKKNEPISLAGKWAPRQQGKYSDMALEIASAMHDSNNVKERNNQTKLKMYRKEYCSPLNAKLNTLERNLSAKNYDAIKMEHIPATALKKTKKALAQQMPEKYREFLDRCKTGKVQMKTTGVQPHELVDDIMGGDATAEIQLNKIIDNLKTTGMFNDTLPLCDVSGSMAGVPMQVSVMLGYIVSQLQSNEFKDKVITFSQSPELVEINGRTTADKLRCLKNISWGMNTDFVKAFRMLLNVAKHSRIRDENMVKRIIVFTDMQFDQANHANQPYETAHVEISRMYEQAGLTLPQIVYWNLRDSVVSIPVKSDKPGVALMNGFSREMLKIFMECGDVTPYDIMMKAVDKYSVVNLGEQMA